MPVSREVHKTNKPLFHKILRLINRQILKQPFQSMKNLITHRKKNQSSLWPILLVVFSIGFANQATAQKTFIGGLDNFWNTPANWSPSGVPDSTQDVIIAVNKVAILNVSAHVKSVTFANDADQASSISLNGHTLTVVNSINFTDPLGSSGDQTINVGTGTLVCDTLVMANTTSASEDLELNISTGTVIVSSDIQMNGATTENVIGITSNGALDIRGAVNSGGAFDFGLAGIVKYSGTSAQSVRATTYCHLYIENSSTKTLSGATTVSGDLIIKAGSSLNPAANSLTVSGDLIIAGIFMDDNTSGTNTFSDSVAIESGGSWNITVAESFNIGGSLYVAGSFTAGSGSYTFTSTNITFSGPTPITFGATLAFSATTTVTNNANISLASSSILSGATATWINNDTLTITTNNFTLDSLIATTTGNLVVYNNASSITAIPAEYYYFKKQGTGTLTIDSGIAINKHFEIDAGTVQCNYQIASLASASVTIWNGATLRLGSSSSSRQVLFPTNIPNGNITLGTGSTVIYNADGNSSFNEGFSYGNLTFTTSTSNKLVSLGANLMVRGHLALNNSTGIVTVDASTFNISVDSSITGAGNINFTTGTLYVGLNYSNTGTITTGTGTVVYDGVSQSIKSTSYFNLIISGSGTKTPISNITVNQDLTIQSGATFAISSNTMLVHGTLTVNGTFTDNNTSGSNTIDSIIIALGGTWSCSVAENFTINGSMSNSGTFTSGSGTYTLATSGTKSLTGTFVFAGNVQINTGVTIQNNGSITISGNLTGSSPGTSIWQNLATSYLGVGGTLLNTGTLTATTNNNTVEYNGLSAQTIKATTYYHLTKGGNGTATAGSGITVNGNITVLQGVLFCTTTITATASGILTVGSNDTLTLGQTSSATDVNFPTNILTSNINLDAASTVNLNTNGTQTFNASVSLGNLGISTGSSNKSVTLSGSYSIRGNLHLYQNLGTVTFNVGIHTLELEKALTGNGALVFSTGTFRLKGNSNDHTGTFTPGDTVRLVGTTSTQHIRGAAYKNLVLDNPENAVITGASTLSGILQVITGRLSGGSFLTVLSTATESGCIVGPAAGNYIDGAVTVQCFVPGTAVKRYRSMGSPLVTTDMSQFIDDMHVTGPGGVSNGFDSSTDNGVTVYKYQESTGGSGRGWVGTTHISNTTAVGQGMLVYIRGDRSVPTPFSRNAPSNDVTIDFTGTLNQGNISPAITYTNTGSVTSDGWNLVANPYASQIDWTLMTKNNLSAFYYIYNPATGSYVADNGTSKIASCQGFFVQATGASPSIAFTESSKSSAPPTRYFKSATPELNITLIKDSIHADMMRVVRGGSAFYSATEDAVKIVNSVVNIYTRTKDSIPVQINCFPFKQAGIDTLEITINGAVGNYVLKNNGFASSHFQQVLLWDKFLNTTVNMLQFPEYSFQVTSNILSKGNRFSLLFSSSTNPLPVNILTFKGSISETKHDGLSKVSLIWETAQEKQLHGYVIQRSNNGENFNDIGTIKAFNKEVHHLYQYTDEVNLTSGETMFYRLSMIEQSGEVKYSSVVAIDQGVAITESEQLLVYPNPATDYIQVKLPLPLPPVLSIQSLLGEMLFSAPVYKSEDCFKLPALVPGVYKVVAGSAVATLLIVK